MKIDVGAGGGVAIGPLDRDVQSERGPRVGAGDHEQVVVGSGVERGRQRLLESLAATTCLSGRCPQRFGKT